MSDIEVTLLSKHGGPLTKRIRLSDAGTIVSDGSACLMTHGEAVRMRLDNLAAFGILIEHLKPNQGIALGALRDDLPERVDIVTKARLEKLNGVAAPDLIARTAGNIHYRAEQPALALIDVDTKDVPPPVVARVKAVGGIWNALCNVVPDLNSVARVVRPSTSSGLYRADTAEQLPGSGGVHFFLEVENGADVNRFLRCLHERCWLAGYGWMIVGAGGQLLERSIVDRMVGAPERLVFEAPPITAAPIAQDQDARKPQVIEGTTLDTIAACGPLSIVEQAALNKLRARERQRLAGEARKARDTFIAEHTQRLIARTGMTAQRASRIIAKQCDGVLLPDVVLTFDDDDLADVTVADVLADPARYEGATLADPLEGVAYGVCKARIMLRPDGTPWIHSFAHGRTIYELKLDVAAATTALEKAMKEEVTRTFVRVVLAGDLDDDEIEALRNYAAQRSGIGKRAIDRTLKVARIKLGRQRAQKERERRMADRTDPRPQIEAPDKAAEWLPQMQVINDVLSASKDAEPPMRDIEGFVVAVHLRQVVNMHLLTARGANEGDSNGSRLPPPEQPVLYRLSEAELAERIERHIEYVNAAGKPVHLAAPFVHHFRQRKNDHALPTVTAVATMPMVLPDGTILSGRGLDRQRGIVFRVPNALEALLPRIEDCTPTAVAEAMRFCADEWLCDVATDYSGKCVLIAQALTILERLLLSARPCFLITAGQRGGGKTTTVHMISLAVLGHRAAAAAWSSSEEERRKALFAFLGAGVAMIAWDNIARGTTISCPSIERALTTETYTDRVLGETRNETVPATTIMTFTGNNISPRGDLASRALTTRIAVDRPDPENRTFSHPDPLAWTELHRGQILAALYTILLGNPRLRLGSNVPPAETRFKMFWHLIGSPIEHAAMQHVAHVDALVTDPHPTCKPCIISFRKLFLTGEADEEQTNSLATVLEVLHTRWPDGCQASEVAAYAGLADDGAIAFKAALEQAAGKAIKVVTAPVITWRLKSLVDAPVQIGGQTLKLIYLPDHQGGTFIVRTIK
jgi:hypothetical protein